MQTELFFKIDKDRYNTALNHADLMPDYDESPIDVLRNCVILYPWHVSHNSDYLIISSLLVKEQAEDLCELAEEDDINIAMSSLSSSFLGDCYEDIFDLEPDLSGTFEVEVLGQIENFNTLMRISRP